MKHLNAIRFFFSLWGSEWLPGCRVDAYSAWSIAANIHLDWRPKAVSKANKNIEDIPF